MKEMKALLIGLCYLVCLSCLGGTATNSYCKRVETSTRIFQAGVGKGSLEVWVPNSELPKGPGWNAKEGPPPISLTRAIETAHNHFAAQGCTNMEILSVNLYNRGLKPQTNFWIYAVSLQASNELKTLVILMDGRTYEPELISWGQLGIKNDGSRPSSK